ncbi:MAG: PAS domain-containing sensor histidine kinase [Acidobacteriota bacterium]
MLIAYADRAIDNRISLGLLYVLPMVMAATALRPAEIIALAVVCSFLRSWFYVPAAELEGLLRFPFALVAYAGSGLFVFGIIRSRAASMELLASIRHEQGLRREVEEQLNILVDSSPAAIVTVDSGGLVLAANKAATELLMLPEGETLKGRPIGAYLPVLADALQFDPGPGGLRTAAQCQGFRENGEIFLATTWFSSWTSPAGKRLAAIIVDSSEEMRDREEENLRHLMQTNQIAATAISHEVRNLCGAISAVAANLRARHSASAVETEPDDDVQALTSLVKGLERIASVELSARGQDTLEEVPLKSVLNDLRIVIEPQWREIGGTVHWRLPLALPRVLGERHGLLQVFLNLAQNSHRAVQDCASKQLSVSVHAKGRNVIVRFGDSGPGVASPERLFAPFQPGADGTGIGLYLSRAVVRGYGGDLRWEQAGETSCFAVELQLIEENDDNAHG